MFETIEEANKIAIRIRKLYQEKKISHDNYLRMCWQITDNIYKYEHLWIQEQKNEQKNNSNKNTSFLKEKTKLNKVSY